MKRSCTAVAIATVSFLAVRLVGAAIASAVGGPVGLLIDLLAVLCSGLLPLCLLLWQRPFPPSAPSLKAPRPDAWRYLLLLPLFIVSVSLLASALTYIGELLGYANGIVLPRDPLRLALLAVLLPALVEELLCRYLCLAPFAEGRSTAAVWVSALLFALLHANPIQIPYALFAGLILGTLAVRSGSILIPILFHLANNLVSVLFFLLGDGAAANFLEGSLLALAALSVPLVLRPARDGGPSLLSSLWETVRPSREECRRILDLLLSPLLIPILLCLWLTAVSCFA